MSKRQLIENIRRFNVTAHPQFLEQFDDEALQQYLDHLQEAVNKRLKYAGIGPRKSSQFRMVS